MDFQVSYLLKHNDHRGYLVEFLKHAELKDQNKRFGQIYYVTFNDENLVRGNHYHKHTEEWFGVIFGSLQVVLEDVNTKEKKVFELHASENEFVRLRIGKEIAHAFKCLSSTAILLDYANRQYDPDNNDRLPYELL